MTTKMLLAEHNVCWPGQVPMSSSMNMPDVSEIEQPLGLVGSEEAEREVHQSSLSGKGKGAVLMVSQLRRRLAPFLNKNEREKSREKESKG